MQLPSVPRKPCGHHDRFVMAAQAAPLSRGLALGVTVFAYPENFVTKRKIQNTTTSAKTRATAMQRQQHLPPNVSGNYIIFTKLRKYDNKERPSLWAICCLLLID